MGRPTLVSADARSSSEQSAELGFRIGDAERLVGGAGAIAERATDATEGFGKQRSGRLSGNSHIYR